MIDGNFGAAVCALAARQVIRVVLIVVAAVLLIAAGHALATVPDPEAEAIERFIRAAVVESARDHECDVYGYGCEALRREMEALP